MAYGRPRVTPIYDRLYVDKAQGGPTVKHLRALAEKLAFHSGMSKEAVTKSNDQYSLANWIKSNFNDSSIQIAHDELRDMYSRTNRYSRPNLTPLPTTPDYSKIEARLAPLPLPALPAPAKAPEPPKAPKAPENDSANNDERYVLRTEYAANVKEAAKEFNDLRNKIDVLATSTVGDLLTCIHDIDRKISALENTKPNVVEIRRPEMPTINTGIVHKSFAKLMYSVNARNEDGTRLNSWLFGPAGTGKTRAAKMVADILFGKEYQAMPAVVETMARFFARFNRNWSNYNYNGSLTSSFQVLGYNDANGRYVPTPFRFAWEFGGVYLFDEIDGSMPDALLALNGALSSDTCSFPDGMVKRHPDCVIMAGANTTGLGGGVEYVGAMKQNAAFLNRWEYIEWGHDDALENALCPNKDWLARVRTVRKNWQREQIKGHLITMRSTLRGLALLNAGTPQEIVEEMVLKCGLSDAQWANIR